MYQVISIIGGEYRHEGFFEDEMQANDHKDFVLHRMCCSLTDVDCDFDVKVIEL